MRHRIWFAALLALAIMAGWCAGLCIVGCASQRAQLRTAADAYAGTLSVLTEYRQAGLIDDQEAAEIERWRQIARRGLDAWRTAVESGADPGQAIQTYAGAMKALSQAIIAVETRQSSSSSSSSSAVKTLPPTGATP